MFANLNSSLTRTVVGTAGMAICAGLCLVGATAPAAAATAMVRSQVVSYADLDLGHPAGRATLDRRIAAAARAVCVTGDAGADVAMAELQCMHRAVVAAKAKAGTRVAAS